MSLAMNLAAAAAAADLAAFNRHLGECGTCMLATRKRNGGHRHCVTGETLRAARIASQRELAREKEADKAPNPDQETLF